MALPSSADDDEDAAFRRRLTGLIELIDTQIPGAVTGDPPASPWQRERIVIRRALGGRPQLPEALFEGLLQAAVYDPDPSFNRQFVEPAVVAYGRRRVQEALLGYLQTGTTRERAGAARAWYWASAVSAPESSADDDAVAELRIRWKEAALREFVANEDLDVRRCILPGLPLYPAAYPQRLHKLVSQAVQTARTHPDEYLRHRVEHQVVPDRSWQ